MHMEQSFRLWLGDKESLSNLGYKDTHVTVLQALLTYTGNNPANSDGQLIRHGRAFGSENWSHEGSPVNRLEG